MFFHYYFFQQQYRCAMFSYHVRHLIFESNLLSNSRFHSTSFINIFFLRKRYTNYFKQISEKNEKNDKFKVEFVDIESGVGRAIFFDIVDSHFDLVELMYFCLCLCIFSSTHTVFVQFHFLIGYGWHTHTLTAAHAHLRIARQNSMQLVFA